MFSIFNASYYGMSFEDRIIEFWKRYTYEKRSPQQLMQSNSGVCTFSDLFFGNNCQYLMTVARRKGDKEMQNYLHQLVLYTHSGANIYDTWEYPTREQLATRNQTLTTIARYARSKFNTRLFPQYALLYMRANMQLGRYKENFQTYHKELWKLPKGVYADYCKNLYANALLHLNDRYKQSLYNRMATEIYAEQGDDLSLMWRLKGYRNVAGIRKIYAENPNSPALVYLIQQFVNGAQETIDSKGDTEAIEWIGFKPVYREDINKFISFSSYVLAQGKVKDTGLWLAATAMLHYLQGQYVQAYNKAEQAMYAAGTSQAKETARCIRLLASTKCHNLTDQYTDFLHQEFRWPTKHWPCFIAVIRTE